MECFKNQGLLDADCAENFWTLIHADLRCFFATEATEGTERFSFTSAFCKRLVSQSLRRTPPIYRGAFVLQTLSVGRARPALVKLDLMPDSTYGGQDAETLRECFFNSPNVPGYFYFLITDYAD